MIGEATDEQDLLKAKDLLARGWTNKQVAEEMDVHISTISRWKRKHGWGVDTQAVEASQRRTEAEISARKTDLASGLLDYAHELLERAREENRNKAGGRTLSDLSATLSRTVQDMQLLTGGSTSNVALGVVDARATLAARLATLQERTQAPATQVEAIRIAEEDRVEEEGEG